MPTLLFVSLAALFAAVLGVVAISQVSTTSVLLLALIVMLLGVVALGALIPGSWPITTDEQLLATRRRRLSATVQSAARGVATTMARLAA